MTNLYSITSVQQEVDLGTVRLADLLLMLLNESSNEKQKREDMRESTQNSNHIRRIRAKPQRGCCKRLSPPPSTELPARTHTREKKALPPGFAVVVFGVGEEQRK